MNDSRAIENFGYKVYSQSDEDGIIQEIFKRIGTDTLEFVEFGVRDGLESNSHYLLHRGWHGLWIEADTGCCKTINIKFKPVIKNGMLKVANEFITRENIEEILVSHRNKREETSSPDFLSIDIDGNDWYVWSAINSIKPRLVCIEYNGKFPPDYSWKQAYNSKHFWTHSDWHGASLKALEMLGKEKGYVLVGTNLIGINAFFVREDLYSSDKFLGMNSAEELYNPLRVNLNFVCGGHKAKYGLIAQEEDLGILNYYDSEEEYRSNEEHTSKGLRKIIRNGIQKVSYIWHNS